MKIDIQKAKDTEGVKIRNKSKLRESITAVAKGLKQGLPVPEMESANREERMDMARGMLNKLDGATDPKMINETISTVYDLLDDGKLNESRSLPPRTRKLITKVASFIPVSYLLYLLVTGDITFSQIFTLLGF